MCESPILTGTACCPAGSCQRTFLFRAGVGLLVVLVAFLSVAEAQAVTEVDFNRDVRPILVDKCFACHGPDAKTVAGDLRVDLRSEALDSGAIVPGAPGSSELIDRIESDDEDVVMPPPGSHKELLAKEKKILRQWIEAGAPYSVHWSYTPVRSPAPPRFDSHAESHWARKWPRNEIDHFVGKKILDAGYAPAQPADRVTLIRRLSLDLNGLPPTLDEVEKFLADDSETAYEQLVDRLLASPRFGERMAIYWLDLVRYADTVGYHGDQDISQSPYRDYVIRSFNENKPYDQFVREQLAGDLLPDADIQQLVASGYNRLNQTTEEGGSQAKEYLAIYFADRVRNSSQVFLGATMGCAQCHDHKFDPYTMKDFYSFGAFFADIQEVGVYGARSRPPMIPVPTAEQKRWLAESEQALAKQRKEIEKVTQQLLLQQREWESDALADPNNSPREVVHQWLNDEKPSSGQTAGAWDFVTTEVGPVQVGQKSRKQESKGLVQHYVDNFKTKIKIDTETVFYAWIYPDPKNPPSALMLQLNDGDWNQRGVWGTDQIEYGRRAKNWAGYMRKGKMPTPGQWTRLELSARDVGLKAGGYVDGMAFTQFGGRAFWDAAGWIDQEGLPRAIGEAMAISPDKRTPEQVKLIRDFYLAKSPEAVDARKKLKLLESERSRLENSVTKTVVSKSVQPRTIRILDRGNWMDDSGEVVEPAIPEFLGKLESDSRLTRLDLANWITQPDNVMTSRVMVNRLWYLLFGRGICASVDDFGGQGSFPANAELLDFLAHDFAHSGWNIKRTLKLIVMSAAYQQSSLGSPELLRQDPENELFARQNRFRIDAEMVRDSVLYVSGLLVEKVGGRSVKPYQPAGYYAELNFPTRKYRADSGDSQYRRGVYTHWQRTFLHPMLKAFDAPSREESACTRARSNTPLQALTLLNDPTFVEAARVYAARIVKREAQNRGERIRWAFRNAVSREPNQEMVEILEEVYLQHRKQFTKDLAAARQLISVGQSPVDAEVDPAELAAWTSVARVLLNLHELTTRF